MEIYIEYALLENFFVDGTLLFLSLAASKQKIFWRRLLLSAALGAAFAVAFPLLPLPSLLLQAFKFFLPLLLVAVAVKKGKGRGRYALTALLFYALSFAFAGLLTGVLGALDVEYFSSDYGGIVTSLPVGALFAALVLFAALCCYGVSRLYRLKKTHENIRSCEVQGEKGSVCALGYMDTGNTARYKGLPVCFVTPDLFYDLYGTEANCEKTVICTLAGEKTVSVCKAMRLKIGQGKDETLLEGVYLSPSSGLIGREYKMLLPAVAGAEWERRAE